MSFTVQVLLFSFPPFILALFLLKSFLISSPKCHKNLPPSPPKLPLIGNLHQLGSSPHRALQAMAQTYGPLMLVQLGSVPVLVASSIDAAKEIMKTNDLIFSNRPHVSVISRLTYDSRDVSFSRYGEYWRQLKSLVVLHVLSNKRVQSYQHVREEELGRMMEMIRKSDGNVINLSELIISFTNNVVCRVALGRRYYETKKFKDLLTRLTDLLGCFSVGSYIPSLWWVDRLSGLDGRVDKVAKEFDEFLEGVIDEHVNKKEVSVNAKDVVDVLLELQKDHSVTGFHLERYMIKAIILDLFSAGTDSTFTVLEWATSELLRNPHVMKQLQQEALEIGQGRSMITEDDLHKMSYLKAVIKETLRLHTPFPLLIPRESTQDINLLGYDIPSGTQVLINVWAIGRDPSNWEQPEEFRPERFLNSPIEFKGFHFELIPFGAGRRRCPGIQYGMAINELVLANLVYKFDLAAVGDASLDLSETNGITAHKTSPIRVIASCRS